MTPEIMVIRKKLQVFVVLLVLVVYSILISRNHRQHREKPINLQSNSEFIVLNHSNGN
jgi:hypothetical protein